MEDVLEKIDEIVEGNGSRDEKLQKICALLHDNIPHYNWVGFYMVNDDKRELVLGPFVGEPTEHVRIEFGRGICGQAALTHKTFLVPDVSKESNYLSCSPKVKSEIVVPIMKDGKMMAQLDIDSHQVNAFTYDDETFLQKVCEKIASLFD
ncbi:MAG TPA: GAF domain-containing protein [Thermoplasmatales archaeon]|nr:GAF domain-containing protein [Thermoplasmatales archaeon]